MTRSKESVNGSTSMIVCTIIKPKRIRNIAATPLRAVLPGVIVLVVLV